MSGANGSDGPPSLGWVTWPPASSEERERVVAAAQVRMALRVDELHDVARENKQTLQGNREVLRDIASSQKRLVELEEVKREERAALRSDEIEARRWRRKLITRVVAPIATAIGPGGFLAYWLMGATAVTEEPRPRSATQAAPTPEQSADTGP